MAGGERLRQELHSMRRRPTKMQQTMGAGVELAETGRGRSPGSRSCQFKAEAGRRTWGLGSSKEAMVVVSGRKRSPGLSSNSTRRATVNRKGATTEAEGEVDVVGTAAARERQLQRGADGAASAVARYKARTSPDVGDGWRRRRCELQRRARSWSTPTGGRGRGMSRRWPSSKRDGEVVAGAPDGAEAERRDDGGFGPDKGGGRQGDRAQGAPLPGSMRTCVCGGGQREREGWYRAGGQARVR